MPELPQSSADWQALTAELLTAAQGDAKTLADLLDKRLPLLVSHLRTSVKAKALLNLWGVSRNYDAQGTPLVAPVVLQAFTQLTGFAIDPRHPHAGLQHTYGYLLSLPSAQGDKAERWLQTALCLSQDFAPFPPQGTLLSNLSRFFLWHLPFLRRQRPLLPPSPAIGALPVPAWQILEETLHTGWRLRQVFLPCRRGDFYLYSYWYQRRRWRLVTVYIVDDNFFQRTQRLPLGAKKTPVEIRLRNNIYLENQDAIQIGWRKWLTEVHSDSR
jgi:hypothetical protein